MVHAGADDVAFKPEFTIVFLSTTSRELMSQFSTCSLSKILEVGEKLKDIVMYLYNKK